MLLCCLALLPQEVLDIQNNLYQVSAGGGGPRYLWVPCQAQVGAEGTEMQDTALALLGHTTGNWSCDGHTPAPREGVV